MGSKTFQNRIGITLLTPTYSILFLKKQPVPASTANIYNVTNTTFRCVPNFNVLLPHSWHSVTATNESRVYSGCIAFPLLFE